MTQPRCIKAGDIVTVTRRATRRHYLFRPDSDGTTQGIYWYATSVMAEKFGIEVHAVQMMSTHIHEVLTDTRGLLPAFLRERNRLLANALKCHRGWPEEVFQRAPACCVTLHGPEAVLKQIGYTLANCVEAGAVHDPTEWPGATVSVDDIGNRVIEVDRPKMYFDPKNPNWPARAKIAITMPSVITKTHGERAREVLRRAVRDAVERAREHVRKAGRTVSTNVARLCAIPITHRSRSYEKFGALNPTFAAGSRASEAIRAMRDFRAKYRSALDALRKGMSDVSFPTGTWRWVRETVPWALPLRAAA